MALVIFFVGRWAAQLVTRLCGAMLRRANVDETLTIFLGNVAYGLLMLMVIMAAIAKLGVNVYSFAAVLAAAGFAVGMALKDSLGNFAAGVMVILFHPFKVGDYIEAGGTSGTVEEIHIFSTIMRTGDNVRIIVPNGSIINGTISNYSANTTRRIDLVVGCGYQDDLKAVKAFLDELIAADNRILRDPEPLVAVNELADSSVNFVVRPWVKADDYWATRRELIEQIKLGFDDRGFSIPYPTQDMHVHNVA
jgi:small conductance mechanosensitive channel